MGYVKHCGNRYIVDKTLQELCKKYYNWNNEKFVLDVMVILGAWSEVVIDDLNGLDED